MEDKKEGGQVDKKQPRGEIHQVDFKMKSNGGVSSVGYQI